MASAAHADDDGSVTSDNSTQIEGSVTSKAPDRYGFIGGAQYTAEKGGGPPADVVLRREGKWLNMLKNYDFYMERHYKKIRERCRKGIPMSVRARAWAHLCGGEMLRVKLQGIYHKCLSQEADPKAMDDIKKDLHRQFPFHEMFCSEDKPGQKELENVLRAYVVHNPDVGYCQAQGPVAAFLLMHMPAEQAFWCLVSICEKYLANYYHPSMDTVQHDGLMLQALLKRLCAPAYKHLKKVGAEPMYYCTEWFLCAFTRTLPWSSLLRVWDIFLCEGIKVLFKVALVILIGCLGQARARKQCADLCLTLNVLRSPPQEILEEEYLIAHVNRLNLTEEDFMEEEVKLRRRLRKEKERAEKERADASSR